MSKGYMPEFELQNEIYLVDGEPCKIYLPSMVLERVKYYWVQYVRNGKVTVVPEKSLKLTKRGKLLYGSKG